MLEAGSGGAHFSPTQPSQAEAHDFGHVYGNWHRRQLIYEGATCLAAKPNILVIFESRLDSVEEKWLLFFLAPTKHFE